MQVDEYIQALILTDALGNVPISQKQYRAMKRLEELGYKFLVDFGYENAEAILRSYKPFYSLTKHVYRNVAGIRGFVRVGTQCFWGIGDKIYRMERC